MKDRTRSRYAHSSNGIVSRVVSRVAPVVPLGVLIVLLFASSGCGSAYLTLHEDPLLDLSSADPNLVALAALEVAASEDTALHAAAMESLCGLLEHRDPLIRSAAARALHTITGVHGEYQPYRDPMEQHDSIEEWHGLVERHQEGGAL